MIDVKIHVVYIDIDYFHVFILFELIKLYNDRDWFAFGGIPVACTVMRVASSSQALSLWVLKYEEYIIE